MSAARSATSGVLAAVVLGLTACAGAPDRPSVEAWQPTWERATDLVDDLGADAPPQEECERVLGELRVLRDESLPGPDQLVDEEVSAWFAEAEHLVFDCPQAEAELGEMLDALRRREEQVTSALDSIER